MKTSNKKAINFVEKQKPFTGSNTFGKWVNGKFVVYSYGLHFPMYVYDNGEWIANTDKYSPTTSKHQSQLRPFGIQKEMNTDQLKQYINN